MLTLAQEVVSHDKTELYAVIGALVAVILYQERQKTRLVTVLAKAVKREEDREDSE